MELFFEAFYQVQSRFKKENLTNQFMVHVNYKFDTKKQDL